MDAFYNITEKVVEDALINWIDRQGNHVIGRQIKLPYGRIDVMAFDNTYKQPLLYEVKKGNAIGDDILQASGYAHQIEWMFHQEFGIRNLWMRTYLVAHGISNSTIRNFLSGGLNIYYIQWIMENNGRITFHPQWNALLPEELYPYCDHRFEDMARVLGYGGEE